MGRDLDRLAADLVDLLEHLGGHPAVLVAHSWGGPIVRTVASQRPDLVAGLVLVDQTDERCDLYFDPRMIASQRRLVRVLPFLARTRLLRGWMRRRAGSLPPDLLADLIEVDASVGNARNMGAELASLDDDLQRLRADPPHLPDVPVTWISGSKRPRIGAAVRDCLVAAHRASAEAHPQGRHVSASRSGHYVMWTEPERVVAEIDRLLRP